jgi:UDP-N-acetylglucosamine 2-epimerase (non-hydrolysing)
VEITRLNSDVIVVYPVHPNPNIRKPAERILKGNERIMLIEPMDYAPFVDLMNRSYLILTDSGGIQEEAPSLGKPVLVMRDVTERAEAVESGTAKLVGTKKSIIVGEVQRLLTNKSEYEKIKRIENPFGDGKASERIIEYIKKQFSPLHRGKSA